MHISCSRLIFRRELPGARLRQYHPAVLLTNQTIRHHPKDCNVCERVPAYETRYVEAKTILYRGRLCRASRLADVQTCVFSKRYEDCQDRASGLESHIKGSWSCCTSHAALRNHAFRPPLLYCRRSYIIAEGHFVLPLPPTYLAGTSGSWIFLRSRKA